MFRLILVHRQKTPRGCQLWCIKWVDGWMEGQKVKVFALTNSRMRFRRFIKINFKCSKSQFCGVKGN